LKTPVFALIKKQQHSAVSAIIGLAAKLLPIAIASRLIKPIS
jgi:hypothetical protein